MEPIKVITKKGTRGSGKVVQFLSLNTSSEATVWAIVVWANGDIDWHHLEELRAI